MRLLDTKTIKHHQNIVGGAVLAVGRRILRHVRWRIAARGIGDGPVAPTKMLKLLFPAAMIAGEFMDEDDRRAASGFLVVQPYAVVGRSKSHVQLRFQLVERPSKSWRRRRCLAVGNAKTWVLADVAICYVSDVEVSIE